jgi:hypothetical protein
VRYDVFVEAVPTAVRTAMPSRTCGGEAFQLNPANMSSSAT